MPSEIIKKAAEKAQDASGALTQLASQACELVESLLGETFRVGGGIVSDQLVAWQWGNRVRIMTRAKEIVSEIPEAEKVVPPGLLMPFLEGSGNVDDPTLQEMWAQLLADALIESEAQHPMFMTTLRQLDPEDAKFLTALATGRIKIESWKDRDSDGIAERLLTLNLLAPVMGAKTLPDNPDPKIYLKTVALSEFGKQLMRRVLSSDPPQS